MSDEFLDVVPERPDAATSPTPMPSAMRYVFFNPEGLRPGWGLLIFLTMLIALATAVAVTVHHLYPDAIKKEAATRALPIAAGSMLKSEGTQIICVVLVTWLMSRIERRPIGTYGFGGGDRLRYFFIGLAWGFGFLTVLVLSLKALGLLAFTGQQVFGATAIKSGAEWAFAFLCVGVLEEYLLRGYLQYTVARGLAGLYGQLFETKHTQALGFWTAAVVLSFVFGFGHGSNPGESPIGLFSAGAIGLVFCLTLWRTGSLWWALGFHAAWDWAQSFVYGVADSGLMVQRHLLATRPMGNVLLSGGATGPEGSALIVPLLAVIAGVVVWTLPLRGARPSPSAYSQGDSNAG